jgi:hypothetical protein
MLFRRQTLEGIARGAVTLAFRRWKRPTAKAGGRVRTAAGAVMLGEIVRCDAAVLSEHDAKAAGFEDLAALLGMLGPEDGNPVYRIEIRGIEPDDRVAKRETVRPSPAEWRELRARFARWEKSTPGYYRAILQIIAARPATLAATLASSLRVEKPKFKQDVRKLKELGLTESLDVGYRLSPRGEVVLKALDASGDGMPLP